MAYLKSNSLRIFEAEFVLALPQELPNYLKIDVKPSSVIDISIALNLCKNIRN